MHACSRFALSTWIVNGMFVHWSLRPQKLLNYSSEVTDNTIIELDAHQIHCGNICAAWSKRKIIQIVAFTVDRNAVLAAFSKKNDPTVPPVQNPYQTITLWKCIGLSSITCGFSDPQMQQLCLLTSLRWKSASLKKKISREKSLPIWSHSKTQTEKR